MLATPVSRGVMYDRSTQPGHPAHHEENRMAISAPRPDGDQLAPADIIGHLLLIIPTEFQANVPTKFDRSDRPSPDAIRVNVAVLTQQTETGEAPVYRGAMWFNVMLVRTCKGQIGETILARMAQGKGTPGQNPPFVLEDATGDPQALAFAEQWLAAHPEFEAEGQKEANANRVPQAVATAQPAAGAARPGAVAIPTGPAPVPQTAPTNVGPVPLPGAVQVQPAATQTTPAPTGVQVPDMSAQIPGWNSMQPHEQIAYLQQVLGATPVQ